LRSRPSGTPPSVHIPVIEDFVDRVAKKLDSGEAALATEVINRNASAHFVGGIPIGETSESGAVDPYLRVFGQQGLHVMDGSVMPANPGVNPSLSITALAERAMSAEARGVADAAEQEVQRSRGQLGRDRAPDPSVGAGHERGHPLRIIGDPAPCRRPPQPRSEPPRPRRAPAEGLPRTGPARSERAAGRSCH
jgi:hypothetical protein